MSNLFLANKQGNLEAVRTLLAENADVNTIDEVCVCMCMCV